MNTKMVGTKILNSNTIAPYWANALRITGGIDVQVKNNLCMGSASNSSKTVGIFGRSGNPLESAIVENIVIRHGSGWNGTDRHGLHVDFQENSQITLKNNVIADFCRCDIMIQGKDDHVTYTDNTPKVITLDGTR